MQRQEAWRVSLCDLLEQRRCSFGCADQASKYLWNMDYERSFMPPERVIHCYSGTPRPQQRLFASLTLCSSSHASPSTASLCSTRILLIDVHSFSTPAYWQLQNAASIVTKRCTLLNTSSHGEVSTNKNSIPKHVTSTKSSVHVSHPQHQQGCSGISMDMRQVHPGVRDARCTHPKS